MTLLLLVMLPILCGLGVWQLDRKAEKERMLESLRQQQQSPVVALQDLPDKPEQLRGRRIEVTGEFDNERLVLVDNRVMDGRIGYEVVALFKATGSNRKLLVNRGWIAAGRNRQELPKVEPVKGAVTLVGEVYVPYGAPFLLGENHPEGAGWPKVVQADEVKLLSTIWDAELYPYEIRLMPEQPGLLQRPWVAVTTAPEKHLAYAVQWFALAFTLLAFYLYSCWSQKEYE